jgi:hypothetical protein
MIFLGLFFLLLVLKLPILNMSYHWDAMTYIVGAHWIKDAHFNPFCYNRLPLLPELLVCTWAILGDSSWASNLLNIFVSSMGLYFTYLIGTYLFSIEIGAISTLLLLACPLYFAQSGILNHEILLTSMSLTAIYFAQKDKVMPYLISASLLVLAKETGFLTIVAIFIYKTFECLKKKESTAKVLFFGIPLIVLVLWRALQVKHIVTFSNYRNYFTSDWFFIRQTLKNRFLEVFVNDFRWILTFFIVLRFSVHRERFKIKQALLPLIVIIAYFGFYSIVSVQLVRYFLPVYPLFFIIGTMSMAAILENRRLFIYIMAGLLLMLSVSQYDRHRNVEFNTGAGALLESNMEYVDVVITHKQAAGYIEKNYPDAAVLTTWPQCLELSYPYLGYVKKPINVKTVYFSDPPPDLSRIDLIYYSPQGHDHFLLLEKIHTLNAFLLKKFERNKKYTAIYKVKK